MFAELIQHDRVKWPLLKSPAACATSVEQFRAKIKDKEVTLSQEMEKCLEDWASGAKLAEKEGAAAPAAAMPAPAPPALAPAAPAVEPPAPAAPALAPADENLGGKRKASLLSLARQAKQAKLG